MIFADMELIFFLYMARMVFLFPSGTPGLPDGGARLAVTRIPFFLQKQKSRILWLSKALRIFIAGLEGFEPSQ